MYFTAVGFEKVSDVNLSTGAGAQKGDVLLNIVNTYSNGTWKRKACTGILQPATSGSRETRLEQKFMKQIFTVIHGTVCCGIKAAAETTTPEPEALYITRWIPG